MLLRQICKLYGRQSPIATGVVHRCLSSEAKYVTVEPDSEMENVAVVKMQKKPVNSLCSDHLHQLATTLKDLASDKKYKAAILTSAFPGIFCAGLDLLSMYGRTQDEIYSFWSKFQQAWINLYNSPLITVAAINGNSPAGGCVLALSCDHRVMADEKISIGLNETKVGIVAPFWVKDTMLNVIGFRETDRALQQGRMFSPSEAKDIGLVDKVAPMDQLMPLSREYIAEYLKLPYVPRYLTKQVMREETIKRLTSKLHEDADFTARFLTQEQLQKNMGVYVQALAQKKKK